MPDPVMDDDVVAACVDLVGRAGATGFEIGYLHDNVPVEQAGWYAHAQLRGARITVQDQPGPTEAAAALAHRILTGAKCTGCGRLVALEPGIAFAYLHAHLADGTPWTAAQAAAAGQCTWTRAGRRWEMGCNTSDRETTDA